ncbi:MAG: hypothetical protein ACTSQJ_08705 [Promethearchaeota archaeon]
MSTIEPEIREKLMGILQIEEQKTDLENLAVLSRVGMKVASATSAELDADAASASSTALIDLGLRLSEATAHGGLREIILHNNKGYCILMAINDEYIVFGGLKSLYRIGYYLGYLREMAKKLNILISGGEVSEMTLRLAESELEKIRKQQEELEKVEPVLMKPTIEQDKEALDDLLGFLDEWEQEDLKLGEIDTEPSENIISIPKSISIGIPKPGETVGLPAEEDFSVFEEELEKATEIGLPKSVEAKAPITKEIEGKFKVYKDEIPPVPLEDYVPIDVEEEPAPKQEGDYIEQPSAETETPSPYIYESEPEEPEELPPLDELPSFDEINLPNFESEFSASEYDTDFVLEEESEAIDNVLKELGLDEEEE